MKILTTIAAAAVISLGFAAQASAYSLSPTSTSFTGTGGTKLTKGLISLSCTANFTGTTDASGNGSITGATFTTGLCPTVSAVGLPWAASATGAGTATIYGVSVSAGLFGTCGPTNLPVAVSGSGVITFSSTLSPNCAVQTTGSGIATSPAVTVVP